MKGMRRWQLDERMRLSRRLRGVAVPYVPRSPRTGVLVWRDRGYPTSPRSEAFAAAVVLGEASGRSRPKAGP